MAVNLTPLEFIKHLRLQQCRPGVRTVKINGSYIRLAFPWVSVGLLRYQPSSLITHKRVFAFFHNEPWSSPEEALKVLRAPPTAFHAGFNGYICVGDNAIVAIRAKQITPAEAFWFTGVQRPNIPVEMLCNNTKNILKVEWEQLAAEYIEENEIVFRIGWDGILKNINTWMNRDNYVLSP